MAKNYQFTYRTTKGNNFTVDANSADEAKAIAEQRAQSEFGASLRDNGKPKSVTIAKGGSFDPNAGEFYHVKDQGYFQNVGGGLMQITDNQGNALVGNDPQLSQKLQSGAYASQSASTNTQVDAKLKGTTPVYQNNNVQTGGGGSASSLGGTYNPSGAYAQSDKEFADYLAKSGLPDDQKKALEAIFGAVSTGDQEKANQLKAAFTAATQYSNPYFKAQTRLALDGLERAFNSQDGDLDYQITKDRNALEDLRKDISASKDQLDFNTRQELEGLARNYESNLENTRQNMAATGFTQSSRRDRTEGVLEDAYGNAVESSNRTLAYQTGNLDRQLGSADQATQLQIQNLQRLAAEGKLSALRQTEEQVGSSALANAGYQNTLGGVGGQLPRQQMQDAISSANAFVF